MWQSQVEIEQYSIVYFNRVRNSVMHCQCLNTLHVYAVHMSPALNGSSALQRFEGGNAIEICYEIMYPGLLHMWPRLFSSYKPYTNGYRELNCIILNNEAWFSYSKNYKSSNSQASQWNTGTWYYGQLGMHFQKTWFHQFKVGIQLSFCL